MIRSHLLQMRGLKQGAAYAKTLAETSHLLQMRGLKLEIVPGIFGVYWSHLLQMRGLKQLTKAQAEYTEVASFTDAWIETNWQNDAGTNFSRIFYRCVD